MSYLEMKYNLLMSYCTFLSFYLLLKLEGKPVEGHPVIFKLAHIKTLFEKLKPLDQKLQYQIEKMIKLSQEQTASAKAKSALNYKPNIEDLQMDSSDDGSRESDQPSHSVDDSDVEDDMNKEMSSEDSESSEEKPAKKNVYKAPKLNTVAFEDPKDKKARQKDSYEKKKLGKSNLMQELMKEVADEPEEVYMGVNKRSKANEHAEMIEEDELENFRRVQMTKKERKAMRNRQLEDMQDKLENLDDDFAAIDNIVKRASKKTKNDFTDAADRD